MSQILDEVRAAMREYRKAGVTQAEIAERLGVTPVYISLVLSGKRALTTKVLEYFGLERVVTVKYRKVNGHGKARPAGTKDVSATRVPGNAKLSRARAAGRKNPRGSAL